MDILENSESRKTLTLGAGCFWCVEAIFQKIEGVHDVESGYSGGFVDDPSYKAVCNGVTGHAEVIQVHYDPNVLTVHKLLEVFFSTHDPTTLNRQGNDVGTQYRSVIYFHDENQKNAANNAIESLTNNNVFDHKIVTEVKPFTKFYPAELHHQNYFVRNAEQGYCQIVIQPKMDKFRKAFADIIK